MYIVEFSAVALQRLIWKRKNIFHYIVDVNTSLTTIE